MECSVCGAAFIDAVDALNINLILSFQTATGECCGTFCPIRIVYLADRGTRRLAPARKRIYELNENDIQQRRLDGKILEMLVTFICVRGIRFGGHPHQRTRGFDRRL